MAAIRDLFDSFVVTCKEVYTMSPYVCVDESLVSFRGHCPFRVYMPSKPAKYGMKIWIMADCGTAYAGNLQVYLGKASDGIVEKQQGARIVRDLSEYIYGSGRNITMDNFFTSYDLAIHLLSKSLTIVGTMRKSRTELPPQLLVKNREKFCFISLLTQRV